MAAILFVGSDTDASYNPGGKRQYPGLTNTCSVTEYQPISRRYLAHGYGDQSDFRPHSRHLEPLYTILGSDWRSNLVQMHFRPPTSKSEYSLDSVKSPTICDTPGQDTRSTNAEETDETKELRCSTTLNNINSSSKCEENNVRSYTVLYSWSRADSRDEDNQEPWNDDRRLMNDRRNGIPCRSPGDKCYRTSECSADFYKFGSSCPAVNFGRIKEENENSWLVIPPLQVSSQLLNSRRYEDMEQERQKDDELREVKNLDVWKPAAPLVCPVLPPRSAGYKSKPRPIKSKSRQTRIPH